MPNGTNIPVSEVNAARARRDVHRAKAVAAAALSRTKAQHAYSQPVTVQNREHGIGQMMFDLCDMDGAGLRPIAKMIPNRDLAEALAAFLNS
jgi:hypothetical protein